MEYYDRLLGGMVASLLLGAAAGLHPAIAVRYGLLGGALLATVFLWEALVRNPPVPTSEPGYAAATVVWHGGLLVSLALAL
ncbi:MULTISPECIES: hypothetical protein [Natrinema]|uniref:Uncharacterized protein n=1 Tax=Natrinema gari JCM 14663 TaxID=1230459 RepID=L9YMN8_9EURY|nr:MULTISPECIES: hypothetical protein [Natrinema]AFO58486.1 hypothetical protein NJ7G_3267 [Natrinema sp. J7-2]ELY75389.1 hypothetical protein C486_19343 [Natrinema gari JCM 14663]